MGFLNTKTEGKSEPALTDRVPETPPARPDDFYADLIARRPGLLDEKLKLHERIIDEFNLTALEKMPSGRTGETGSNLCRRSRAPRKSVAQSERARSFLQ